MNKLLKGIYWLAKFHKRLGYKGVIFLFKIYFAKNQTITFSHKKYLHPIFVRNNTSDISTYKQVILNQEYDVDFNFIPNVILDCGANIGLATVYFKNRFPNAKIISIEPEQSNFELLLKNTKEYKNIHCLNFGLWYRSSNLLIKDPGFGHWGYMIEESNYCNSDTIKAITINEVIEKFDVDDIDILKIDIEGSEKELFETNYKEWLPRTKVIIIELHDTMRKGSSKSFFTALSHFDFSLTLRGENIIVFMKSAIQKACI